MNSSPPHLMNGVIDTKLYGRGTTISISDADSIPEQLSQLISLMQLSQAPGTKKIQNYS